MISVSVNSKSDGTIECTAMENERVNGEITAIKENAKLYIKEMRIAEKADLTVLDKEDMLILELLIKSCVNYCMNRDVLNIVLKNQKSAEEFYALGFCKTGRELVLNVPLQMAKGCNSKKGKI